ncbi:MAG: hypothetical protein SGJ23_11655 [Alphaproteobacteria bacterium]|nr:hypothetical protein [Alphaproteobacteria bacterium]MDZ4777430.1 hypothetical protein [Alphaproteobacteria bacterium]
MSDALSFKFCLALSLDLGQTLSFDLRLPVSLGFDFPVVFSLRFASRCFVLSSFKRF